MSDVRDEMVAILGGEYRERHGRPAFPPEVEDYADAILGRFDVTPKPVITVDRLGGMCAEAFAETTACDEQIGTLLDRLLSDAGLKIVRVNDERG